MQHRQLEMQTLKSRERVAVEVQNISSQTVNNLKEEFYSRLCYCQQLVEEHVEHYF